MSFLLSARGVLSLPRQCCMSLPVGAWRLPSLELSFEICSSAEGLTPCWCAQAGGGGGGGWDPAACPAGMAVKAALGQAGSR